MSLEINNCEHFVDRIRLAEEAVRGGIALMEITGQEMDHRGNVFENALTVLTFGLHNSRRVAMNKIFNAVCDKHNLSPQTREDIRVVREAIKKNPWRRHSMRVRVCPTCFG